MNHFETFLIAIVLAFIISRLIEYLVSGVLRARDNMRFMKTMERVANGEASVESIRVMIPEDASDRELQIAYCTRFIQGLGFRAVVVHEGKHFVVSSEPIFTPKTPEPPFSYDPISNVARLWKDIHPIPLEQIRLEWADECRQKNWAVYRLYDCFEIHDRSDLSMPCVRSLIARGGINLGVEDAMKRARNTTLNHPAASMRVNKDHL